MAQRVTQLRKKGELPRKVSGGALLSGNIYCTHDGGKLFASTTRKNHHPCAEASDRISVYKCYNRTQRKGCCTGVTSYRAEIVDKLVRDKLRNFFEEHKSNEIIQRLTDDWEQSELPVQKMIASRIIERVEISSSSSIEVVFHKLQLI